MSNLANFSPAALLLASCAGVSRVEEKDLIETRFPQEAPTPQHTVQQHRIHDKDVMYLDVYGSLEAGGSAVFKPYDETIAGYGTSRWNIDAGGPLGEWGKLELNNHGSLRYGPGAPEGVSGGMVTALALSEASKERGLGVVAVHHLEGSSKNHSTVNDLTAGVRFNAVLQDFDYNDVLTEITAFSIDATTNGDISWFDANLYTISLDQFEASPDGTLSVSYRSGDDNKLFRLELGLTFPQASIGHFVPTVTWGFENDQMGDATSHSDHRMYLSAGLGSSYSGEVDPFRNDGY